MEQNEVLPSKFFKLARKECTNYFEKGPRGIEHYCWLEPKETEKQCCLLHRLPCESFTEAVLPLDPDLQRHWERMLLKKNGYRSQMEKPLLKRCRCGKYFRFKSNRHKYCQDCAKRKRRKQVRESVQKHRQLKKSRVSI